LNKKSRTLRRTVAIAADRRNGEGVDCRPETV
jgi:hypothetical protein